MVALVGPITDGYQAPFAVVKNPTYVDMPELREKWANVVGIPNWLLHFGGLEDTMVGGEPAVMSEYLASDIDFEYVVVDHGGITYLIFFSSSPSQFHQLWSTDAKKMLASLSWSTS